VVRFGNVRLEWLNVSIDKSLKRKSRLARVRSVLTRPERIDQMKANEKWVEGSSPFGIPKTRVIRLVLGKKKKKKAADGADGAADKKKAAKKK
jgi:small basic protein (TIGR04137 family)